VMQKLHDLNDIAYVRFASVYREFKDVNDFVDELKRMLNNRSPANGSDHG
jgi:transcriptional repressor NrdR